MTVEHGEHLFRFKDRILILVNGFPLGHFLRRGVQFLCQCSRIQPRAFAGPL